MEATHWIGETVNDSPLVHHGLKRCPEMLERNFIKRKTLTLVSYFILKKSSCSKWVGEFANDVVVACEI